MAIFCIRSIRYLPIICQYVTVQSTVKKIKEYERQLVLADERIISMSDIVSMQFLDRP